MQHTFMEVLASPKGSNGLRKKKAESNESSSFTVYNMSNDWVADYSKYKCSRISVKQQYWIINVKDIV